MDVVSNFCPAMAVPTTVKMPYPITAPIPSAVSETGPRVFFSFGPVLPSPRSACRWTCSTGAACGIVRQPHRLRMIVPRGRVSVCVGEHGRGRPCLHSLLEASSWLPLRLSARHLFHFALLRSARVIPRFLGLLRFDFLARCAPGFLAFFFAQVLRVGHLVRFKSSLKFLVYLSTPAA